MNLKRYFNCGMLTTLLIMSAVFFSAQAGQVNVNQAREKAGSFLLKQRSGKFAGPTAPSLTLVHAEPSAAVNTASDYYAFNINGGGFIIMSGEDRAIPVLGYSDNGHLDFNNLPDNFKALMRSYQEEIEYLHTHPKAETVPMVNATNGNGVAPLIKTYWGQEMPYYLQCPIKNGEYCVVGCIATAMAQVMYYWKYPTYSAAISSYYCSGISQTVPALPETTFDYSKMLSSYCHWDWDNSVLVQDEYTDEQAQEVAKLSRYCGQAVEMGYSPDGSGAYTSDQLAAMKTFGYSNNAEVVSRDFWWWENYTTAEWEAMIKAELDAAHPLLYSASDPEAGGHAFICDGYDANGMFHFNFGWYGTCDGWYASTALNMVHRSGEELHFNSNHDMITGLIPPSYCLISSSGAKATNGLIILGENMAVQADDVNIFASSDNGNINLLFGLTDANGQRKCMSNSVTVNPTNFEQGSTVNSVINLPTTLPSGIYQLNFYYKTDNTRITQIECDGGQLQVIGRLAKYNEPFDISDVTQVIGYLLNGSSYSQLDISDVTTLIGYLLYGTY
ncbi:MAG: C10 family peptidase [Muribaculaceae bacterium]|nr:C10 family peptidase [Muribaculaceae bacterium]MBR5685064.1 C10 family peptidase [Muribaculaceae bacterium]